MTELGRLALRQEGKWWNAYWAPHQYDMDKAVFLGSIRLRLATGEAKQAFLDAMRKAFDNACKDVTGQIPDWGEPKPAPENERAGQA